jgi:hypothetical protein
MQQDQTEGGSSEGLGAGAGAGNGWLAAYCAAYYAAWERKAEIFEGAAGWYRIRTDLHGDSQQYRRKQIEQMTQRLRDIVAGRGA